MNEFAQKNSLYHLHDSSWRKYLLFSISTSIPIMIVLDIIYIIILLYNNCFLSMGFPFCVWFGFALLFGIALLSFVLSLIFHFLIKGDFKFICSNCLKTIELSKLKIECPFCSGEILREQIFRKHSCGSYIGKIACYHCGEAINLLEPYNGKELEAKRYGG